MKMSKTIPIFILLFTVLRSLCNGEGDVTATMMTMHSTHEYEGRPEEALSPPSEEESTESSALEPAIENDIVPARHLSALLVSGISISFVLLFILIVAGFWYARKKSKGNLAEMNSVLSSEPGVSLRTISVHEN